MVGIRLLLTAIVALSLSASVASAGSESASTPEAGAPVPSLEPERTEADWRRLAATRAQRLRTNRTAAECRPLRAVFYAASDWLRLATKLAESASPCAEYYVSVPPLVADKTTFRREQASRIRALGPNFHALAEVHFTTWNRWVASTGSSWHTAGVTARQRMAEAGYDVSRGDSWALNELSTAVRRGEGNARANVREFIRGLYEGDGARPTKGAVLVVGFGQRTSDVSVYQSTLQSWLADTSFWSDLSTYVSDWSQEVYGDVRAHAVPGVPTSVRREYLNDYLQHKLVLASAGPVEIEPARAFLRDAYSPLANAAWPRDTAWGWTAVPVELMSAYVSAQVNALRHFSASTGQSRDHWGFAWAPRNTTGMSNADFVEQTGRIQSRIAAAIRDSGDVVEPENPGSGACGPPGQDTLCLGDLPEAAHNEAWRSFRGWTQAVLRFATPPQSVQAGVASGPIALALQTSSGAPVATGPARVVTLRASSPQGAFATSAAGPWTTTLSVTVAPSVGATFHYRGTRAGAQTITASAAGVTAGTYAVTVTAAPAAAVAVTPSQGTVRARGQRRFTASATDAYGNAVASGIAWRVSPATLGTIEPGTNGSATFTAGRVLGTGRILASAGAFSGSAAVTVTPASLRIASLAVTPSSRGFRVLVGVVDGARRPISTAVLTLVATQDGRRVFTGRGVSGSGGRVLFRVSAGRGCFRVSVVRAHAQGFRWTGQAPRRSVCRR